MDLTDVCSTRSHVSRSFAETTRFMTEGRAITLAILAVDGLENPLKVQQVVKTLLKERPKDSPEEMVIYEAMRVLAGEKVQPTSPPESDDVFENLAWAWQGWACGQKQEAATRLGHLDIDKLGSRQGVFSGLALASWAKAIEALILDQPSEAKRHFKRAMDVGGQFGLEINPPILWTYAASFCPRWAVESGCSKRSLNP